MSCQLDTEVKECGLIFTNLCTHKLKRVVSATFLSSAVTAHSGHSSRKVVLVRSAAVDFIVRFHLAELHYLCLMVLFLSSDQNLVADVLSRQKTSAVESFAFSGSVSIHGQSV